jgi:hypothetical protein
MKNAALSQWRWCADALRLKGSLDTTALRRSLNAIVRRHEALRTRFVLTDDGARQQIDALGVADFAIVELSGEFSEAREERAVTLISDFLMHRVDLSVGPLFSAKLYCVTDTEHILVLKMDHLITDAFSNRILRNELWEVYRQAIGGLALSLPPLQVQFADYAIWQHQTAADWMEKHGAYWKARLPAEASITYPFTIGVAAAPLTVGSRLNIPFGEFLSIRLREAAAAEDTLVCWVVLAGYLAFMTHFCNQRDLIVAVTLNGRVRPELQNTVGFLVSDLYMRVTAESGDVLKTLLGKVKQEFDLAYEHYDFDRIPRLIPGCKTQLIFNWMPVEQRAVPDRAGPVSASGGLMIEPYTATPVPPYTFGLFFHDDGVAIDMDVIYRRDLFSDRTVEKLGRTFVSAIGAFTDSSATVESISSVIS